MPILNSSQTDENAPPPDSLIAIRTIAMPADTNPHGNIFGGWLMSQMDMAGSIHAYQRAAGRVTTVAVEAMEFHHPVKVGDVLSCYTQIKRIGKSSIAVLVEAWVARQRRNARELLVTSATFTYVAVDEEGKKRVVPAEE